MMVAAKPLLGSDVSAMTLKHDPVMIREILEIFALKPGAVVVDGTLGLAGHSLAFASAIGPMGVLVGLDWDQSMLSEAESRLQQASVVVTRQELSDLSPVVRNAAQPTAALVHTDYRQMSDVMEGLGLEADAILLDLGLNSAQIADPERGIAFQSDGPLDMRMDRTRGEPASALLNRLSPVEIERILWDFGDERWAKAIARTIVERRRAQPLRTTQDLVEAVMAAVPAGARDRRIHPATRTFQAVRISVNSELDGLDDAISDAAKCLAPGGRLAVLSYHSGEDRAAKTVFRGLADEGWEEMFRKPAGATPEEISRNPRSRSAKLRLIQRPQESV